MSAAMTDDTDFASAFADLALLGDKAPTDTIPEPVEAEPAPAEPAPEALETQETAPETPEAPVEAAEETPEPAPKPTENTDDVLERLARLVAKDRPPSHTDAAPEPAPAPQAPQPIYTPEEQTALAEYEKDWPDVARNEALRRRAEYRQLVDYVFGEVAKELRPLLETVEVLATRTHLTELQSTVTDYDGVRDKVVDWVGTQPKYLQVAYEHVIKQGTVDEIADLVDRYKRDTGQSAAPAAAPARKTEPDLAPAAKQAAASLAPIRSKRTVVTRTADPNDFEAAFREAAETL